MREFNLLEDLPKSDKPRIVHPKIRTIKSRIIAAERGKEFYDGNRENGYGGYTDDGRWKLIARKIIDEYHPNSILQICIDIGFLLNELYKISSGFFLRGTEVSEYALEKQLIYIKSKVSLVNSLSELPFGDDNFDFIIALGLYCLSLEDIIRCLKQIQTVGRGKSFIVLGAFETEEEEKLFRQWTLLGTTILSKNDWLEVLKYVGYTGDYYFTTAKTLNLVAGRII